MGTTAKRILIFFNIWSIDATTHNNNTKAIFYVIEKKYISFAFDFMHVWVSKSIFQYFNPLPSYTFLEEREREHVQDC